MTKKVRKVVGYSFLGIVFFVGSVVYAMLSGTSFGAAVLGTFLIFGTISLIGTGMFILLSWIEGDEW